MASRPSPARNDIRSQQRSDQHQLLQLDSTPYYDDMAPPRSSLAQRLPLGIKNHVLAMAFEFVGTFMFLFFALGGTNAVNTAPTALPLEPLASYPAKLFFICMCFGMSLGVNVAIFYRLSGGLFNPAVTIGLMAVGAVDFVRGVLVMASQLLGAIASAAVLRGILPGPLKVDTTLRPDTSLAQGVFIEMFLTALLVLTILFLAVEKSRATFVAPVVIGLALLVAEMMGVPYTGGSLNPARSFGPCVANAYFEKEHWIYWVGPILGALLAAGFYKLAKLLEYETVNPGQDDAGILRRTDGGDVHVVSAEPHYKNRPDLEAGSSGEHGASSSGR